MSFFSLNISAHLLCIFKELLPKAIQRTTAEMSISLAWIIYLLYFHKYFSTSSWIWQSEILPLHRLVLLLAVAHFYWIWLGWFCLQDYFGFSSHPPFCLGKPAAVWSQSNRLLIPSRTDICRAKLAWCWRYQPDVSQRQIYLHLIRSGNVCTSFSLHRCPLWFCSVSPP